MYVSQNRCFISEYAMSDLCACAFLSSFQRNISGEHRSNYWERTVCHGNASFDRNISTEAHSTLISIFDFQFNILIPFSPEENMCVCVNVCSTIDMVCFFWLLVFFDRRFVCYCLLPAQYFGMLCENLCGTAVILYI